MSVEKKPGQLWRVVFNDCQPVAFGGYETDIYLVLRRYRRGWVVLIGSEIVEWSDDMDWSRDVLISDVED
jgi:hypothetical protein